MLFICKFVEAIFSVVNGIIIHWTWSNNTIWVGSITENSTLWFTFVNNANLLNYLKCIYFFLCSFFRFLTLYLHNNNTKIYYTNNTNNTKYILLFCVFFFFFKIFESVFCVNGIIIHWTWCYIWVSSGYGKFSTLIYVWKERELVKLFKISIDFSIFLFKVFETVFFCI